MDKKIITLAKVRLVTLASSDGTMVDIQTAVNIDIDDEILMKRAFTGKDGDEVREYTKDGVDALTNALINGLAAAVKMYIAKGLKTEVEAVADIISELIPCVKAVGKPRHVVIKKERPSDN